MSRTLHILFTRHNRHVPSEDMGPVLLAFNSSVRITYSPRLGLYTIVKGRELWETLDYEILPTPEAAARFKKMTGKTDE